MDRKSILLISPYWKEDHRWMVSSVKLAELWQRLGYRVDVLCMGDVSKYGSTEKVSDTLTIHRVKDWFLPDPWNYGIAFGFSGKAAALAKSLKPDVIVVNKVLFWSSISLLRLRMTGHRVLLITDALVGITWWPRGFIARVCAALYARTLGWLILKAATKIVFFHPQPEGVLRRLRIANKSSVIPTGIDPAPFAAPRQDHDPVTVTYIGRMESVKGADDYVAAALQAKKDIPTLRIRAVGWYKPAHPLASMHGQDVEFTGLRHDIPAVLGETDIFVLPSYSEGLSNALMEAMASGAACIASDVGGNRFLIQNGVSGFLFPAGDREALAGHIRRLAEDVSKRRMLGEKARERIRSDFSWDKVGRSYDEVFRSWISA
jgi:glycosyltransferase involved in cell wall biosynthesis